MKPILAELKRKMGDKFIILKIDIDKSLQAASGYKIQGAPTLFLFHRREIKWRQLGVVPLDELEQIIKQHSN